MYIMLGVLCEHFIRDLPLSRKTIYLFMYFSSTSHDIDQINKIRISILKDLFSKHFKKAKIFTTLGFFNNNLKYFLINFRTTVCKINIKLMFVYTQCLWLDYQEKKHFNQSLINKCNSVQNVIFSLANQIEGQLRYM